MTQTQLTFDELNEETVEHVNMLHSLAKSSGFDGRVVVATYGQDPETGKPIPTKVKNFKIGDVTGTLEFIKSVKDDEHRNIYAPLTVLKPGVKKTAKGEIEDIAFVLGLVADFDDDRATEYNDRLPMPADYVLKTSSKRFQAYYLFERPLTVNEAKPLAEALWTHCQCDHGTKDLSHVWRVPGCKNWPNKKKVDGGRSPEPQMVEVCEE